MIGIACPSDRQELQSILIAAFERSCGVGSVQVQTYPQLIELAAAGSQSNVRNAILILVSPPEESIQFLKWTLERGVAKVIIFGAVPPSLAQILQMRVHPISEKVVASSKCAPATIHQFSESSGHIKYIKGLDGTAEVLPSRALCRYDYASEWNNLGFGAITTDGSIWSLSQCADVPKKNILSLLISDESELSAYCALWDYSSASLLWFNREAGPIDSYEWRLIEIYISQYRFADLPAWPVLLEIPYGYDGAVTMRLDCDEDVESARALFEAYREWGIPISLALHATVLRDSKHHQLPREVIACGGAILSHTLTHAPNWGGSQAEALREGKESASIINQSVHTSPRYAVSPFHQTPLYARLGLAQAGYQGCIGGIIANDPDFVMARGGRPPHSDMNFIGHTQQCMLHGDCLLEEGDSLAIYKRAFDQSISSKTLFGYLDHPFSERYQYGWGGEEIRIEIHKRFIQYISMYSKNILFLNENDALDFLFIKSHINIEEAGEIKIFSPCSDAAVLNIAVEYGKNTYCLKSSGLIL